MELVRRGFEVRGGYWNANLGREQARKASAGLRRELRDRCLDYRILWACFGDPGTNPALRRLDYCFVDGTDVADFEDSMFELLELLALGIGILADRGTLRLLAAPAESIKVGQVDIDGITRPRGRRTGASDDLTFFQAWEPVGTFVTWVSVGKRPPVAKRSARPSPRE